MGWNFVCMCSAVVKLSILWMPIWLHDIDGQVLTSLQICLLELSVTERGCWSLKLKNGFVYPLSSLSFCLMCCCSFVRHTQWRLLNWLSPLWSTGASLVVQLESACSAGDLGSIPGLGRYPGDRNGNPLQYSCLENSMDRGAWQATVHGVAKSRTRLSD